MIPNILLNLPELGLIIITLMYLNDLLNHPILIQWNISEMKLNVNYENLVDQLQIGKIYRTSYKMFGMILKKKNVLV
jgi:hypothetical protein